MFHFRKNETIAIRNGINLHIDEHTYALILRWGPRAFKMRYSRKLKRFHTQKLYMRSWEELPQWVRDEPHCMGYTGKSQYEKMRQGW